MFLFFVNLLRRLVSALHRSSSDLSAGQGHRGPPSRLRILPGGLDPLVSAHDHNNVFGFFFFISISARSVAVFFLCRSSSHGRPVRKNRRGGRGGKLHAVFVADAHNAAPVRLGQEPTDATTTREVPALRSFLQPFDRNNR